MNNNFLMMICIESTICQKKMSKSVIVEKNNDYVTKDSNYYLRQKQVPPTYHSYRHRDLSLRSLIYSPELIFD